MSTESSAAAEREDASVRRASGVQTVDRALDVIEALARRPTPLGVSEIARHTGLPQGTVHRLLLALQARGYVRRDSERRYTIGAAAIRFSEAAHQALVIAAAPHLAHLVDLSGETASLSVLEDVQMVYVAQVPSPHTLRIFTDVGERVPVHSTAAGKVALACLGPARTRELLARAGLPADTHHTITDLKELQSEIARVREQGFAIDDEEREEGVRGIAVPVCDSNGVVAAVSVTGPAGRLLLDRARSLARPMSEVADAFCVDVFGRATQRDMG